jgi:hypothetical protein
MIICVINQMMQLLMTLAFATTSKYMVIIIAYTPKTIACHFNTDFHGVGSREYIKC